MEMEMGVMFTQYAGGAGCLDSIEDLTSMQVNE